MNAENSESAYHTQERKKSNLAFAFFCMQEDRAKDMEAFYAFCRLMDDIADEEGVSVESKKVALTKWKAEISNAYANDKQLSPLGEEMRSLVRRRNIPENYVQDIIDGVMRDTIDKPFETFEDIKEYCYGVASAVGLVSIYIFGFKNEKTKEFAEALGYALQFTNILRDVLDDIHSHNRIYIPYKEMEAFGVSKDDLINNPYSPKCKKLYAFLYFRAKHFFNKSRRLLQPEDKRSLAPALIMWAIYEKILDSLKALDFQIPVKPFKISKAKKIALALKAIRESKKPEPTDKKSGKVTILGAGVSGMYSALRLAKEGFDVSVIEAKANLGGRFSSINWNNTKLNNATHATMGCYKYFFWLFDELNLDASNYFYRTDSMQFLFDDGKKIKVEFQPEQAPFYKKIFASLTYTKLDGMKSSASLLMKLSMGFANANPQETALEYLKRQNSTRISIKNFWEPFCVSALNTDLDKTDANLMIKTARKSILKGGENGVLYLPKQPMSEALNIAKLYIESVGGSISLSENVQKLNFVDNKITSITTSKNQIDNVGIVISALNVASIKNLLPEDSNLKKQISNIEQTDITNIYFTTSKKLLDGNYACIIGSPIHWIFEHSKLENSQYIYAITISASTLKATKKSAQELLNQELKKFFGDVEIIDILPSTFIASTISADSKSESSRPTNDSAKKEFTNLNVCGDWVQTDLPCTLESAAKSTILENLL